MGAWHDGTHVCYHKRDHEANCSAGPEAVLIRDLGIPARHPDALPLPRDRGFVEHVKFVAEWEIKQVRDV